MLNSLRKLLVSDPPKGHVRRWQRILMSEPARVVAHDGQSYAAMLTQLGAGGARVAVAKRLRPGDTVDVEISVGVGRRSLPAMVVHATKEDRGYQWQCGLCFIEVDPRGDRRIAQFVEEEQRRRQVGFAMPRA